RDSKYRCKAVHSLSVSTTSYYRHVVSTVQSSISSANNGTVLNRHRRRLTFHTFHIHNQIHLCLVSIFPFFPNDSFSSTICSFYFFFLDLKIVHSVLVQSS